MQSLIESLPNYIHYGTTMNFYQEVHGITSITYDTTMRSHQEVHGIMSNTSNTTMESHQEFHGIMSISYHNHAPTHISHMLSLIMQSHANTQPTSQIHILIMSAHQFQIMASNNTCIFVYFIL